MLLPSAISCDTMSQPPLTRLQAALFASPPSSPPQLSAQSTINNIFSTCRSLQALLASAAPLAVEPITPPTSSHAQLPTPPLAHAPPPMKLRLRSHRPESTGLGITNGDHPIVRKRVVKRSVAQPPRGLHKRRRSSEDDMDRSDDDLESDLDLQQDDIETLATEDVLPPRPQTPKRARIAPEILPLGLERLDYHSLHAAAENNQQRAEGTDVVREKDGEEWSTEDDRVLVELVLEKLRLSKEEWQDCARSLGKDRGSVGRRWKSLVLGGEIGLARRGGARRAKLHGTWR